MAEMMTVSITVMTGVLVYVLGELASGLFVERINVQARTIEEIAQKLIIHAPVYLNEYRGTIPNASIESLREVQLDFRRLAALLSSTIQTLRWYSLFQALRLVENRNRIQFATEAIIGLSNSIGVPESGPSEALKHRDNIRKALGIRRM